MDLKVPLNLGSKSLRTIQHSGFWLLVLIALAWIYSFNLPGFWFSVGIILPFLPLHMGYFYAVAYIGFPWFLYSRQYLRFFLFVAVCLALCVIAFRLVEIFIADPIIVEAIRKEDPDYVWHKLDGSVYDQLLRRAYLVNAIEQTNFIVWIALGIKLFKMWYEKQQAALEAELGLLKGQLHPHFLFNTLNNLYALTLNQSPRSPAVVIGLSEILRYMLYEANAETVFLKRDIEILQNYVALEKIRYEERLDLTFSANGILAEHKIAPLLILPLVENAFKHGASEKVGDAWINIDLHVKDGLLKFKISNSKPETRASVAIKSPEERSTIGLANVRKRLEILYPSGHKLRTLDEDEVYAVILEINLNKILNISLL